MKTENYYLILDFERRETVEDYQKITNKEIREAYRKKARQVHPDKNIEKNGEAFDLLKKAYDILSDQEKRNDFHDQLRTDFEAFHEQTELIFCRDSEKPSVFSDCIEANHTSSSTAIIPYQTLKKPKGINVSALIRFSNVSSEYLLTQAKMNVKLAEAFMSSSDVLQRLTFEQRYQLLCCLISGQKSENDILEQKNAHQLISQLSNEAPARACRYVLTELFSTPPQQDEKIQQDEYSRYDWLIKKLTSYEREQIILNPNISLSFLKYYLRNFGSQTKVITVVQLINRFKGDSQQQLLKIYEQKASETNKRELHYFLSVAQADNEEELTESLQAILANKGLSPVFFIQLARIYEGKWEFTIILHQIFNHYSVEYLSEILLLRDTIDLITYTFFTLSIFPMTAKKSDCSYSDHISKMLSYLEQHAQLIQRKKNLSQLELTLSIKITQFISSLLTFKRFAIDNYNEEDQKKWIRLFFQCTGRSPNESLAIFLPLFHDDKNNLFDFFKKNKIIFREFMRVLSISLGKSPDAAEPIRIDTVSQTDSKSDIPSSMNQKIVRQIVPVVYELELKDDFLELFPDSRDYYGRFEQAKKYTATVISHEVFESIKDVLEDFQEDWIYILPSDKNDILQLLSIGLAYFNVPENKIYLFFLRNWINILLNYISCQDLLKCFEPRYHILLIKLISDHSIISLKLLSELLEKEPQWVQQYLPPAMLGNLIEHTKRQEWKKKFPSQVVNSFNICGKQATDENDIKFLVADANELSKEEDDSKIERKFDRFMSICQAMIQRPKHSLRLLTVEGYNNLDESPIIKAKLQLCEALKKTLTQLSEEKDEKTVCNDATLTNLSQLLKSVVVTKDILDKLEQSLKNFPALLLMILEKIQNKEIPTFGSIEQSISKVRQVVLSKNPRPEIFFFSRAQQILDRSLQTGDSLSGDLLQTLGTAHPEIASQIQQTTSLSSQLKALEQTEEIIFIKHPGNFISTEINHVQQFERIINGFIQISTNLQRSSSQYLDYKDMGQIHNEILALPCDGLDSRQKHQVEILQNYFPYEEPTNFILWILKIASTQEGLEFSYDFIFHWLTCQDFIPNLANYSACADTMLMIIRNCTSPTVTQLKDQLINMVWEIIQNLSIPITFFHIQVLLCSSDLPIRLNELSDQITSQKEHRCRNRIVDIHLRLLEETSQEELQTTLLNNLVAITSQLISLDLSDNEDPYDVKQSESFAHKILECQISPTIYPSSTQPNIPLHHAIASLFHLLQSKNSTDSLQEKIFSDLISLATWQDKFPSTTPIFVMRKLTEKNLLPHLLKQFESQYLENSDTVATLLLYLLEDNSTDDEVKAIPSASEYDQKTNSSLLEVMQDQYQNVQNDLHNECYEELIRFIQKMRESSQSTPYEDQLAVLLFSYLKTFSQLTISDRTCYLETILRLLKQLEISIGTPPLFFYTLQNNIVKERIALQTQIILNRASPSMTGNGVASSPFQQSCLTNPLHLKLNISGWNAVLSEKQEIIDEVLRKNDTNQFSDTLPIRSYLNTNFYKDWHQCFIEQHGDNDSALYQLNQQLKQYIQTHRFQDIHTRRRQIKKLLQFVYACQQVGYESSLQPLYDNLRYCIEIEYDFVYRYLHDNQLKATHILQPCEAPSLKEMDQRPWYRKLWSYIHRFFGRKRLQFIHLKSPHQVMKYAIVEHANFCQRLITSKHLDYQQWQILLRFYNQVLKSNKDESLDQNNRQYVNNVADRIVSRFTQDHPTHQRYLTTNFNKIIPILKSLLEIQHTPKLFSNMITQAIEKYGYAPAKWPPLTLKIFYFFCLLINDRPYEDNQIPSDDDISTGMFYLLADQEALLSQCVDCIDQKELPHDDFVRRMKELRIGKLPDDVKGQPDEDAEEQRDKQIQLGKQLQLAVLQQHCRLATAEDLLALGKDGMDILRKFGNLGLRALEHEAASLDDLQRWQDESSLRTDISRNSPSFSYWDLPKIVFLKKTNLILDRNEMTIRASKNRIGGREEDNSPIYSCQVTQVSDSFSLNPRRFLQDSKCCIENTEIHYSFNFDGIRTSDYINHPAHKDLITRSHMVIFFGSKNPVNVRILSEGLQSTHQAYRLCYDSHHDNPHHSQIHVEPLKTDHMLTSDDSAVESIYSKNQMESVTTQFMPTLFRKHQALYPQFTGKASPPSHHQASNHSNGFRPSM